MKKFLLLPILILTIVLFSFTDYDTCSGLLGHKALACSSCHGFVIAGNVWDGKVEANDKNPTLYDYEIVIPTLVDATVLQLITGTKDIETLINPKISIADANTIYTRDIETVFNATSLLHKKDGNDFTTLKVKLELDKVLEQDQTFIIQGVYGNNDGTPKGDKSFYQEVTLKASNKTETNPLFIPTKLESFYNSNQLHIATNENTAVRIMDLQGKVVHQSIAEESTKIDVAHLNKGAYFVVLGNSGENMESFQFVK